MMQLIDQAQRANIPESYVLFDTWFCFTSSITQIKKKGLDVIAMLKKTPKMYFRYNLDSRSLITRSEPLHLVLHKSLVA